MKKELDYLAPFPRIITSDDLIPKDLWPSMPGVRDAKVVIWEPTKNNWHRFWKEALKYPLVSVDYETDGLRPFHGSRLCGVAASFYDGIDIQALYVNFRHLGHRPHPFCRKHVDELTEAENNGSVTAALSKRMAKCATCKKGWCPGYVEEQAALDLKDLQAIVPAFRDQIIGGMNFKFDIEMGWVDGLPVPERVLDIMLIAHLYDENKRRYNLELLGAEMGGEGKMGDTVKEYAEEHGIEMDQTGHAEIPCNVEGPYAVMDTVLVLRRLQFERERWLELQDPKMMEVFQIETAMTPVFARMEINGMKVDPDYLKYGVDVLTKELAQIKTAITTVSGVDFDVLSGDELWKVLEARGFTPVSLTLKDHKPSLTDDDLSTYQDPVCELVKAYRTRSKMLGTYFKPYYSEHRDPNDLIHANFFIHGTVSGRVSCREPNLENIPRVDEDAEVKTNLISLEEAVGRGIKKGEEIAGPKLEVKRCFVPRGPDFSLVSPDESQMEMRVLMFDEYAYEEAMVAKVNDGMDFHVATASEVFQNFPKKKDDNPKLFKYLRQQAKKVNFGIVYGEGVNKLAAELGLPVDECVRAVRLVQAATAEGFDCKGACTYTAVQLESILKDHAVMTASRQWMGLKSLGRAVSMKINPEPLEEFLLRGDEARHEKYRSLEFSARTFLDKYHAKMPRVKKLTKGIEARLGTRGYIHNRYGRRYHLITDKAYVGINRLVQGSSADMIKVAMWRVDRLLRGKKTVMINQVHDSLPLDVHHSELDLIPKVKECMEFFPGLRVKMQVDVEYGHNSWAESHKWVDEDAFKESLREARLTKSVRI